MDAVATQGVGVEDDDLVTVGMNSRGATWSSFSPSDPEPGVSSLPRYVPATVFSPVMTYSASSVSVANAPGVARHEGVYPF